jgi:hypothetical protein
MLSRPTTDQIILDCRAELLATIDAAITDPAAKIAIQMMENVLRNCAERAAHEIAWMHEEIAEMIAIAEQVQASAPTDAVQAALDACRANRTGGLHLDEVVADYDLAGECLSAALDAAMSSDVRELQEVGRAALERRLAHEQAIMGEWAFVGRG